jgi:lysyl-tRNA synthetase class 1
VRFNYVADNFDPLRKVYPFLDAETYQPLVGRPLSEIVCPCGKHSSYSDHFLEPFLAALRELHVDVEVERADRMYKSGRMNPYIVRALERTEAIATIIEECTGKRADAGWSPFTPLCSGCGRINQARVVDFSAAEESIEFACACGASGTLPMAGGGKLSWRIDWPARWMALGVTVEPFGKDHATRGGSYDTGKRIVAEVFDGVAPFPIPYEWIRLKGMGDMSSSKGNVLSIGRILEVVPPEALRYLVIRERPQRTINFDPGIPLLKLVDDVDDPDAAKVDRRSLQLSRAGGFQPVGVPYKHLVVVAQAAGFDVSKAVEILRRTGHPGVEPSAVAGRMRYARNWLDSFAPEEMRFSVQPALPAGAKDLDANQKRFLGRLAAGLQDGMGADEIHALVYDLAGAFPDEKPAAMFRAIYMSLLGKPRGPRAGWFIALLGPASCAGRFQEAAEGEA